METWKKIVQEMVLNHGIVSKDEIVEAVENLISSPEYKVLHRRRVSQLVNVYISKFRDEKGRRIALSQSDGNGKVVVNIQKCDNVEMLQKIEAHLMKLLEGTKESLKAVKIKKVALQVDMFAVIDVTQEAK